MTAEPAALPGSAAFGACRYGHMVYLANDRFIGRSLHAYGEYSEAECALLRRLLAPGDRVVEAGANVGAHTLALSRIVGAGGRVVAFEPQPLMHRLLAANLALAGAANVEARGEALGSAPGTLHVPPVDYGATGNFGGVALTGDGSGTAVRVRCIDELELTRCDLVKVDVEGMERDVVEGARDTIRRHRPVLYVENDRRERSQALIALLLDLGYRLYWHLPYLFNPHNFRGVTRNLFPGIASINVLCLPDARPPPLQRMPALRSPADWWR